MVEIHFLIDVEFILRSQTFDCFFSFEEKSAFELHLISLLFKCLLFKCRSYQIIHNRLTLSDCIAVVILWLGRHRACLTRVGSLCRVCPISSRRDVHKNSLIGKKRFTFN